MKHGALRMLVRARRWANTSKGEKIVVDILAGITAIGVLSILLLMAGIVQEGR